MDGGAGALSGGATVSIDVLPVNDAPLLADPAGRVLPGLVESDTDNAGVPVAFVIASRLIGPERCSAWTSRILRLQLLQTKMGPLEVFSKSQRGDLIFGHLEHGP